MQQEQQERASEGAGPRGRRASRSRPSSRTAARLGAVAGQEDEEMRGEEEEEKGEEGEQRALSSSASPPQKQQQQRSPS